LQKIKGYFNRASLFALSAVGAVLGFALAAAPTHAQSAAEITTYQENLNAGMATGGSVITQVLGSNSGRLFLIAGLVIVFLLLLKLFRRAAR